MKIKLFRAQLQILPEGGIKAWFEKRVVITRKGESMPDHPVQMPNVNRVFAERDIWLNEKVLGAGPFFLLVHPIINSKPHPAMLLVGILAFALAMYLAYIDIKRQGEKKPQAPKRSKARESVLRALARMEQEEAAKRVPQPKKTTIDPENRIIDWGDPNETDRIPIEELINEQSANYYKNFSYNFLEQQQKKWVGNKNAQKLFLNFYKTWSRHKGWGNKDNHPHREDIKKLAAFDLSDWKEPVSITTPL